jgi:hypothetical protein
MGNFATFAEKYVKYIAIAVAAVGIPYGAALAGHYSTATSANPVATTTPAPIPTPTPLRDYWIQTPAKDMLSGDGQTPKIILRLTLPAGTWIVHAEQTIVNFGPSDWAGCSIGDSATLALNTHRTIVGNPEDAGAVGSAPLATFISETAAVTVPASTLIMVTCEHDNPTPRGEKIPYIDPGADLWADQSASVESPQ